MERSQVQHTDRISDVRAVIQHQTPVIRTVQETAEVPQTQQLDRAVDVGGCAATADVLETKSEREAWRCRYRQGSPDILKLVFTETADERPGADAADGFATTESELAVSSGEAAEREQAARSEHSKSICKACWRSSVVRDRVVQCQDRSRTHGVSW